MQPSYLGLHQTSALSFYTQQPSTSALSEASMFGGPSRIDGTMLSAHGYPANQENQLAGISGPNTTGMRMPLLNSQATVPPMTGGQAQTQTTFQPTWTSQQIQSGTIGNLGTTGYLTQPLSTTQPSGYHGTAPNFHLQSMTGQPNFFTSHTGTSQPGSTPFTAASMHQLHTMQSTPGNFAITGSTNSPRGTLGSKYAVTSIRDGTDHSITASIFALPALGNQSVEEARLEDYRAKTSSLVGFVSPFSQMPPGSSLLSSMMVGGQSGNDSARPPVFQSHLAQPFASGLSRPADQSSLGFHQPPSCQSQLGGLAPFSQPSSSSMFAQTGEQSFGHTAGQSMFSQPNATGTLGHFGSCSMPGQQGVLGLSFLPPQSNHTVQSQLDASSYPRQQRDQTSILGCALSPQAPSQPLSLFSNLPSLPSGPQANPLLNPQALLALPQTIMQLSQTNSSIPPQSSGPLNATRPQPFEFVTQRSYDQLNTATTSCQLFQPNGSSSLFTPSTASSSNFALPQPSAPIPSAAHYPPTGDFQAQITSLGGPVTGAVLFSDEDYRSLASAYRDTHGLSWLFSTPIIEDLLCWSDLRYSYGTTQSSSIIERVLKGQRSNGSTSFESWGRSTDPRFWAPKRPVGLLGVRSFPRETPSLHLSKRSYFDKVKFEPFCSRDDTTYLVRNPVASAKEACDMIEIDIVAYDPERINFMMAVPKSMPVWKLIDNVESRLRCSSDDAQLVLKRQILRHDLTLAQAGVKASDSLDLVVVELPKKRAFGAVSAELLPKLTTTGYSLEPSMQELARMTTDQLKNVEKFTVKNQHGKIEFIGLTNVTSLNIDQIVKIEACSVCVYPDNSETIKPKEGHGLNKPAKVTLYNCKPKKTTGQDEFLAKIRRYCKVHGCEFLGFKEGTWEFRVKHF